MDLAEAFRTALRQIATLDLQLVEIIALSLKVTLTAVTIASAIGFVVGGVLAVYRFPGRGALAMTMMAGPKQVIDSNVSSGRPRA